MDADDARLIVAVMSMTPEVTVNDSLAMVFTIENMMMFPAVENYTISVDRRMASTGNNIFPNDEDLSMGIYERKLFLTTTGY